MASLYEQGPSPAALSLGREEAGARPSHMGRRQAVVLLFPSALLLVLGWMRRWTAQDAFVDFRVVDQVLAGNGPVFNAGERVEAYTSALWMMLLSAVHGVLRFVALEWISVVLALALAVGGLLAATLAARLLSGPGGRDVLPLGALAFVALPPVWDFATSGLESGLSFAWLGGTYLALVVAHVRPRWGDRRRLRLSRLDWIAVLAGLGPLIRVDFAIFSAAFLALLLVVARPLALRRAVRLLVLAALLPVLYQMFRMGYFAAVVPNTAIAEEAGLSRWGHGWEYLWDTAGTYWLFLPVAALLGWVAHALRGAGRTPRLLVVLPVIAGLAHVLFVVKAGGDSMHARLLLPGLLAILMPVAVVQVDRDRPAAVALAALVVGWAFVCTATLRPTYLGIEPIRNERSSSVALSGEDHPVTVDGYASLDVVTFARDAKRRAQRGEEVVLIPQQLPGIFPARPELPGDTILAMKDARVAGYAAGEDVRVVDSSAGADPIASRFRAGQRTAKRDEKLMEPEWVLARFADPAQFSIELAGNPKILQAHRALTCGGMRDVIHAVASPMSPRRLVDNIRFAPRATAVRWSGRPHLAEQELCG